MPNEQPEQIVARQLPGQGEGMEPLRRLLLRLAGGSMPVLILGESGTGKEFAARALHAASPRAPGPFVAENCAAVPEGLFESLLFGHVRGAFSGAVRAHEGLFQQARGGTLLLDEIGELPLLLQARLLRAVQERQVRPLGASETVPLDVRIVAATNADLSALVSEGRFRSDLLYRLRGAVLELPPLRRRMDDLPLLAAAILSRLEPPPGGGAWRISPAALRVLLAHDWPGNVRELSAELERAAALAESEWLIPESFSQSLRPSRVAAMPAGVFAPPPRRARAPLLFDDGAALQRAHLERALASCGGHITETAAWLGWTRQRLYRQIRRLGIRVERAPRRGGAASPPGGG